MRLGALELADAARSSGHTEADVIFATSLLSLPDLRAALPASLRTRPAVLYMHENQAAYPDRSGAAGSATAEAGRDAHFALTNLASVLTADLVLWNSVWNRTSFQEGIRGVLRHAPDLCLDDLSARIEAGRVVWPPVEPPVPAPLRAERTDEAVRVVWPHRWEHDKGPDELLEIADRLSERLNLRWTLLGERFRAVPPELERFGRRFAARIDHIGFEPDRAKYWAHLSRADWVLSTARHEFFGVAVAEALLAGCLPWLPARLSYPELIPESAHDLSPERPPSDPERIRRDVRAHLAPAVAPRAVERLDAMLAGL